VKSILGAIQTNLSDAPQISKASCLDIAIPGIFGVPIEEIITHCILLSMQEKEVVDFRKKYLLKTPTTNDFLYRQQDKDILTNFQSIVFFLVLCNVCLWN